MSQSIHEHSSINSVNFKAYNQHSFNIKLVSSWIETDDFNSLPTNEKIKILSTYKEMLLSKSYIDHFVFERKAQLASNYRLLKKLGKHFEKLDVQTSFENLDVQTSIEEIKPFLTNFIPNYLSNSSYYEQSNQLKAQINEVNTHRLDGVWSRGFTKSILDFNNINWPKFNELDAQVDMVNGLSSYGLYFLRGGMDAYKLIKHSFSNNLFYKNHDLTFLDKLSVQWELRYSQIINDIVLWGPVNAITYHGWRDAKGDLLTAFLLIADLTHSIYNYFKTITYFDETLKCFGEYDFLKNAHELTIKKQLCFMAYQILLVTAFSAVCGFFFFNLNKVALSQFSFYGSLVCFSIQILVNLIDFAFELKAAQSSVDTQIACFKIFTRVMVQLTIPALFIASAYLLPLLEIQLPSLLVVGLLMGFSSLLVKVVNDINQIFELYVKPELLTSTCQDKALEKIKEKKEEDFTKSDLHPELNALIDDWVELYEASHQKYNAYNQFYKDLWLTASYINASVALCILVSEGLTINIVAPVIFSMICISMCLNQNNIEEDPKIELSAQLGFVI